ncbi:hypothetical protein QCA50_012189 [Cerrena zonata]|uniref:Uncharacterized protein n=1 Tax=Cerrena zonata TaxID=2478898 RepID=A0AAW0FSH8_9APHY
MIQTFYQQLGNFFKAIDILHDALAISPNDSVASDLLKRALEANKDKNEIFMKSIESQELNLPTLQYRKHKSNNILEPLEQEEQPILNSSFIANSDEVSTLANELKRGEETSDDDDGEIMDIESD